MEFKELIQKRRSVRNYTGEPVSHEDLAAILAQAQQAPSWKNSQNARCYVVESAKCLEEFRGKALPSFNQNSSANAALIVTTFVKKLSGHTQGQPDNELGDLWGAYDLGLHDAYLVLAAKDAGYDTLIMGLRDADAIRQMLQIPEEEEIVSVIAIGKGGGEPLIRSRKKAEEVTKFF